MQNRIVGIVGTGIYIPEHHITAKEIAEATQGVWKNRLLETHIMSDGSMANLVMTNIY